MDGRDELFNRDVAELDQSWVEPRLWPVRYWIEARRAPPAPTTQRRG